MPNFADHEPRGPGLADLLALPALVVAALTLAGPLLSGDLFWHLSTGRWLLGHDEFPTTDPFGHTAGDTPWSLHQYGS